MSSYTPNKRMVTRDFRSELETHVASRVRRGQEIGYTFDADMSQETIEAGVAANAAEPRITPKMWGNWLCGASIHSYPERVVVKCQSIFFRQNAEQEIGALLVAAFKRPVHFQLRVAAKT